MFEIILIGGRISFNLTFVLLQRDGTRLFNFVSGYPSWADYLRRMATDGTWGDHIVLHAAADYFETCILVISTLSHDVTISPKGGLDRSNPLVLGHMHEGHYVSLLPPEPGKKSLHAVKKSLQTYVGKHHYNSGFLNVGESQAIPSSYKVFNPVMNNSNSCQSANLYISIYQTGHS